MRLAGPGPRIVVYVRYVLFERVGPESIRTYVHRKALQIFKNLDNAIETFVFK